MPHSHLHDRASQEVAWQAVAKVSGADLSPVRPASVGSADNKAARGIDIPAPPGLDLQEGLDVVVRAAWPTNFSLPSLLSRGPYVEPGNVFCWAEANRKHRERICRGKVEAIRKGKKPAGPTPFGYLYDRKTAEWSIDPELGPIVVEIFTRVSEGETCEAIARDLQARGVPRARPSKSGGRPAGYWIRERVHQIVRARTYLGRWTANKARALSVPVPQIVSTDLYERADKALISAGRRGQLRNSHEYLLQGISTCGVCGARIGCASSGTWASQKGKRRVFYYICSKRRRPPQPGRPCSLPMLRSETVDGKIWEAVVTSVIREHLCRVSTTTTDCSARPASGASPYGLRSAGQPRAPE